MILEHTTHVEASPGDVYHFFEEIETNHERWHPDHIEFRWVSGAGLERGAQATFDERIGGKRQRKTVRFSEVDPNRDVEFAPIRSVRDSTDGSSTPSAATCARKGRT